jgi:hypothetical protein
VPALHVEALPIDGSSNARFLATDVLDGQVCSYLLHCLDNNFIRVSSNNQADIASV